jgi:hypothetical protein
MLTSNSPVGQVYPDKGTVCFSAGLHGWAFTLTVFARLYAKKVSSRRYVSDSASIPTFWR